MMLPPSCSTTTVNPKTSFTLNTNTWAPTDVSHFSTLSKQSHVIITYQYAGHAGGYHIIMRFSIDSVPQKHTVLLTGDTAYAGNFGLWQGLLNSGVDIVTLEYRSPATITNNVSPNLDWHRVKVHDIWYNRALTIITC